MYLKKILTGSIAIGLASSLYAYEMKPVGFKSVGMGGTGVASTRGSLSGYYNPALLRMSDYTTEISLGVTVGIRESNLIDNMDKLSDIDFDTTLDNLATNVDSKNLKLSVSSSGNSVTLSDSTKSVDVGQTASTYLSSSVGSTITIDGKTGTITSEDGIYYLNVDGLDNSQTDINNISSAMDIITNKIGTKNAFQVSIVPALAVQASDALAVGVYATVDVGFRINFDSNYDQLIVQDNGIYYSYDYDNDQYTATTSSSAYTSTSLEYAVDNGINYISVTGDVLTEVPLSYAKAYDWKTGKWSFGINLKYMDLTTYDYTVKFGESSDNADEDLEDYETTYDPTFGIDLGIAYIPKDTDLTVGLVAKNVNSPKFSVEKSNTGVTSDYEIDPLVRTGISYPIWNNNIEFALDIDLTKNDTLISGEESQFVGAGIELHPASWFALRLGAMQDMASEIYDDGTIFTAGLGFGLKWFQFDLSVMASTETGEYDGDEIPRYAAANFSLISRWGDGYNQKEAPEYETSGEDFTENVAPTKVLTDEQIKELEDETKKLEEEKAKEAEAN